MKIRRVTEADVPDLLQLTEDRGWVYDAAGWRFLLSLGECYAIDAPDTGLAGTVSLFRQDATLASIGMMLVRSDCARRGLARRLMEHALREAGSCPLFLYATELGRPLYEQLGFTAVGALTRFVGEPRVNGSVRDGGFELRAMRREDLATVARLDAHAFGVPRKQVLDALFATRADAVVALRGGDAVGFGLAQHGPKATVLGPVVAEDSDIARAVASHLTVRASGLVQIDVPDECRELARWSEESGLEATGTVPAMTRGISSLPGHREAVFAIAGRALG